MSTAPDDFADVPLPGDFRSAYPVLLRLPVQWGDQDSFQHVNNTAYFRWFESARIAYMLRLGLASDADGKKLGLILASIQCNFLRPVHFPDTIVASARISRIGRSSMTMDHAAFSQARGEMVAEGTSTVVAFDYSTQSPVPVPAEIRQAIAALQGAMPPS
ncbi:MAG: acyl-CoA thioesterase [Planctomycetia bacterium]|nr:acyl-CoA thioesterase [Planctomycetia bacterium]